MLHTCFPELRFLAAGRWQCTLQNSSSQWAHGQHVFILAGCFTSNLNFLALCSFIDHRFLWQLLDRFCRNANEVHSIQHHNGHTDVFLHCCTHAVKEQKTTVDRFDYFADSKKSSYNCKSSLNTLNRYLSQRHQRPKFMTVDPIRYPLWDCS